MKNEMEEMHKTDSFFTLSQCGVPTLEKCSAVLYELCTVRCAQEKCASARVQVGVVFTELIDGAVR